MKFIATLLLALAIILPYYFLSNGTFYLTEASLSKLSFGTGDSIENYFTHLFTHVGLQHLMANLIPLILFGLLLEAVVGSFHVFGIFLFSGILSSIIFTTLNPFVVVVGASTGAAGLMVASTVLRPKAGLVFLIATFFLLLVSQPLVAAYNNYQVEKLVQEKAALQQKVDALVAQNKTAEAQAENKTLEQVQTNLFQTSSGIQRESVTPTDLFVHLLGAIFGGLYVFLFLKNRLEEGLQDFEDIGEFIFEKMPAYVKNKR